MTAAAAAARWSARQQRWRRGISPLCVSTPHDLNSCPSTRPTHPGGRDRAAQLQGQIYGGQFDTTPFSDEFFDQLFEGATGDVRARANELGTEFNPFAPATALYAGLEQGGNVQGTPLISVLRSRNRNAPMAAGRGVGNRGVF